MTDYLKLAEQYINKQEKFYNRPLRSLNKFLLKDFAEVLKKSLATNTEPEDTSWLELNKEKVVVALITEDVGHLTGGRYYAWFLASALLEIGYDVTVYTNRKPVFEGDFKNYKQPKIEVIAQKAKDLENIDIKADIYLGSPISGNIAAARLGKKYNRPSFALIFDPFPMMAKYLGDKTYAGWIPLIKELRETNCNIISLCDTTSEFIYDWLNKTKDQVIPIFPCINSREVGYDTPKPDREDYVVFISRLVNHKNFDHVVKACKNLGVKLKVISSVDGIQAEDMVKRLGMRKNVEFCMKCNDREKFDIIFKSQAVVNASMFEGFGMYLTEAIATGTPCVCYEYPTFREIEKFAGADNIYMAKYNNMQDLENKLKQCLEEKKFRPVSHLFDFDAMVKRVSQVFTIEPKIGVITIALNEEQYIEASLTSVIKHPNIKKVAVVEGAVNLFAHAATKEGLSLDDTADKVFGTMHRKNGEKIIYERYGWALDKSELRNRALTLLGKDITHVLIVDADEVWKQEDLDNLVKAMRVNPKIGVFLFKLYHFWKQKNLVAVGGQWDSTLFRCFKYHNKALHWKLHQLPVVDSQGRFINITDGSMLLEDVHVYHFGYLKKVKNVQDKLEFYRKRDGANLNVKDTWTNWKPGDPTQPTHGSGTAIEFKGTLPEEVKDIC
jgi:glycosyltransferase involved in cell wall biosynthesis